MDISWIITPATGAVIGYTTNWVAIKMLFRPYNEKRVLGWRVPFTPGLIPKERERIAFAVGQVVEEYLLTDEVITRELSSDHVQSIIRSTLNKYWDNSGGELDFNKIIPQDQQEAIYESVTQLLVDEIFKLLQDESFSDKMLELIWENLSQYLEQNTFNGWMENHNLDLDEIVGGLMGGERARDALHHQLSRLLDPDKQLSELIGEGNMLQVKALLNYHEPHIQQEIRDLMRQESFAGRVQAMISDLVSQKLGALGAMFVNAGSIYDGLVEGVEKQLDSLILSNLIYDYLKKICDRQLYELLPQAQRDQLLAGIEARILDKKWISGLLRESIGDRPLDELLGNGALKPVISASLKSWISKTHEQQEPIYRFVKSLMMKRLEKPISFTKVQQQTWTERILGAYLHGIRNYFAPMLQQASLAAIVSKQINTFGVELLEDMILTIAKKELSAITWLGALLGFVMAVLSLLL